MEAIAIKNLKSRTHSGGGSGGNFLDLDDLLARRHYSWFRSSIRDFVKKEISPTSRTGLRKGLISRMISLKEIGDEGHSALQIPTEYGGGGFRLHAYGLIMQEIERGTLEMRSTAFCTGFFCDVSIYKFGFLRKQRRKSIYQTCIRCEFLGCFGCDRADMDPTRSGMVTNFQGHGRSLLVERCQNVEFQNSPMLISLLVWAKNWRRKNPWTNRGAGNGRLFYSWNSWQMSLRASALEN